MATVKVKTKVVKDPRISEMFNQMIGATGVNMKIVYPKYRDLKAYLSKLMDVLDMFVNRTSFMKNHPEFEEHRAEINQYVTTNREIIKLLFCVDYPNAELSPSSVTDEEKKNFSERYEQIKTCSVVSTSLVTCNNLVPYRRHIDNDKELDHRFILTMAGTVFQPFPFTTLNLKQVFSVLQINNEKKTMEFLMVLLNKIYHLTYNVYRAISSPDVDINEFVDVIMSNISEVKKQIPRCDKAFKKIIDSVELLKDKFGEYYKDFVQSKNQTIIMENFVLDVAKNTNTDPETTRQFREIIKHYRKIAQTRVNDPRLKMLFDKVSESFDKFNKRDDIDNIKDAEKEDSEDNEENEEEVQVVTPEMEEENKRKVQNMNKTAAELAKEFNNL